MSKAKNARCSRRALGLLAAFVLAGLTGCGAMSVAHRNQLIGSTGIVAGSLFPSTDVEQTYYLGSFDPRSQVPPAIYRIRVRGQSSFLNRARFASSWVPAEVVDALTGSLDIDSKNGKVSVSQDDTTKVSLEGAGRGLILFGPEGFREAPRKHRLVVIMGASPEDVEQAFSSALGSVAKVKFGQSSGSLDRELFSLMLDLGKERDQLRAIGSER